MFLRIKNQVNRLTVICLRLLINITFGFTSLGEINPILQTRWLTPCHLNVMKSTIRFCMLSPDNDLLMALSVALYPDSRLQRAVTPGGKQWPYIWLSSLSITEQGIPY